MLSAEQSADFDRDGLVRLPAAFDAGPMTETVWKFLSRRGIERDELATWPGGSMSHLQGLRSKPVFTAVGGPATTSAIDSLLGEGAWKRPRDWGQFLITFPGGHHHPIWHLDSPYSEPLAPLSGVMVWSFVNRVEAGMGGPLLIAGSHRLSARFTEERAWVARESAATCRKAFYVSHPWLKAASRCDAPEIEFSAEADVDGLPARVVELVGEPGDIVLTHPLMQHSTAPNRGDQPRFMRIARLRRCA